MLTNISKLQVQIENKLYQFLCDIDSPLPHVEEALLQHLTYVRNVKAQQQAAQEKAAAEAAAKETPVAEDKPPEQVVT